jgi:hypothetical protein
VIPAQTLPVPSHDALDAWGRRILHNSDPRYVVLGILFMWLVLVVLRRVRYKELPPFSDQLAVVLGLFALWGVFVQAVVFLMTKPPAIDLLDPTDLLLVPSVCLIAVVGNVVPQIFRLFFPQEVRAPRSAESSLSADNGPQDPPSK